MLQAIASSGGVVGIIMFPIVFKGADPKAFMEVARKMEAEVEKKLNNKMSPEEKMIVSKQVYKDFKFDFDPPSLEGVLPHFDYVINLVGEDCVAIGTDFDGISIVPKGFENISKADSLRELMLKHGYSETRIKKIFGENVQG